VEARLVKARLVKAWLVLAWLVLARLARLPGGCRPRSAWSASR
jgi:hypothetical protein